jgi:hypothetical protein
MATFRKLHITFWTDPFVENLTQEQKLFYLYLITNTKTSQSGIYEISKKYIAYETGFSNKEVNELLEFFESKGKILYSQDTNEIAICNWNKFNYNSSYQTITCVHTDLLQIKNIDLVKKIYTDEYLENLISDVEKNKKEDHKSKYTPLIQYLCDIHTPSMDNKQQEQEQEQKKEHEQEEVEVQQQVELQEEEQAEDEFNDTLLTKETSLDDVSYTSDSEDKFKQSIINGLQIN